MKSWFRYRREFEPLHSGLDLGGRSPMAVSFIPIQLTQADTLDGRLGRLCCHREMVGNGSDVRRGIGWLFRCFCHNPSLVRILAVEQVGM